MSTAKARADLDFIRDNACWSLRANADEAPLDGGVGHRDEDGARIATIRAALDRLDVLEKASLDTPFELPHRCAEAMRAVREIATYQLVDELRERSEEDWGLPFEEALEMAYENVLAIAAVALSWPKPRPGDAA